MSQHDARSAAHERDFGLRRISRLTWQAGTAGAGLAAIIGLVLAHHADATVTQPQRQQNSIVIPAQPPQPAAGSGQVNSGAS
jgi:hypothetical protein